MFRMPAMTVADGTGLAPAPVFPEPALKRLRLLILDVPDLSSRIARCRWAPLVTEVTPGALSAELLHRVDPDCIAFSLFSMNIDSHRLLLALRKLGYAGNVVVVSPRLPQPRMVMAELRSHADRIRLRLIQLD